MDEPPSTQTPRGLRAALRSYFGIPLIAYLMIGALLAGGLALTIGPASESGENKALQERGVTTRATVVSSRLETTRINTGPGRADADLRRVKEEVRFLDELGIPVRAVAEDCAERPLDPPGTKVEIIYDPEHPELHSATRFTDPVCDLYVSNSTPFTIAGVVLLGLAFLWWAARWRAARWRSWGFGIAFFLLGALFFAASFDEEACGCRPMVWFGALLASLGLVALLGRLWVSRLAR